MLIETMRILRSLELTTRLLPDLSNAISFIADAPEALKREMSRPLCSREKTRISPRDVLAKT
jgi:hypothetical protein